MAERKSQCKRPRRMAARKCFGGTGNLALVALTLR